MIDPDPLLTGPEAARRLGLAAATWRSYVSKGYAPKADDADDGSAPNRRNPRWLATTIDAFAANRIGQGKRRAAGGDQPAASEPAAGEVAAAREWAIRVDGPHCKPHTVPGVFTYAEAEAECARLQGNRHVRSTEIIWA